MEGWDGACRLVCDDKPWIERADKKVKYEDTDFLYLEDVYVNKP